MRRAYHPRRCGLCYHGCVFDTRTGLNSHASQQHGYYYSLKGDCFVPLGGHGVRRHAPLPPAAGCCGFGNPRWGTRGCRVTGRTRPPHTRGVLPDHCPRGVGYPFRVPQVVRSGVVTVWRQPGLLDFDVEVVFDNPPTSSPPAGLSQSHTPPSGPPSRLWRWPTCCDRRT